MTLQQCHNCGGEFLDEYMADWTICRGCMQQQMEQIQGEPVYMDNLGICWTKDELEESGGQREVDKMVAENKIS